MSTPPQTFELESVTVSFGGLTALADVDLSLEQGEVMGLIGPNGAGKTTLLNVMSGYQRPDQGVRRIGGRVLTTADPATTTREGVARTFQNARLFDRLSVKENIALGALGKGASRGEAEEVAHDLIDLVGLSPYADLEARTIPYGASRLVGVARAVATGPTFLLLDEPAAGLNDRETEELRLLIEELVRTFDLGVLVVEHDMPFIMNLCDRIQVLNFGRTLAVGTPDDVRSDPDVVAAYLGEEELSDA